MAANTQENTKTEEMGTGISSEITTETDTGVAENLTVQDAENDIIEWLKKLGY